MTSIAAALRRVKHAPVEVLSSRQIEEACADVDHDWRDRTLGPIETMHAMVTQAVHANATLGEVARIHHGAFTASAFCQARQRLPLAVFTTLFHRQCRLARPLTSDSSSLWIGHRTWLLDSTGFSMPDTAVLREYFGQSSNQVAGCGFPVSRLLTLFEWSTGMLLDFIPAPLDTGEGALAPLVHPSMHSGDIVLADCNFGSFGQLALALRAGVHCLFEMHVIRAVAFEPEPCGPSSRRVESLGQNDQVVEWIKPERRPAWMDEREFAALPPTITVREVRRTLTPPGGRKKEVVLVTTLLDAKTYSADALVALYARRWQIEVHIRTVKHALKLDVLRSRTVDGVLKDLTVIALVYNMVRTVMLEAATAQNVEINRVSFTDALRWWRYAEPNEPVPRLVINPSRPGRHEPRVRKRRPKAYPPMQIPRAPAPAPPPNPAAN